MHKIIYSKVLSLVPAVCTEKCTTLGCTHWRGRTWKDHQGIKDMAQCIWCSPSSQSKHPALTDDPQVTMTQASNFCIIVLFDVQPGGHEIDLSIYRVIFRYIKPAVKKIKYVSWGRDVSRLNLNHVPDQTAFPSQLSVVTGASHSDCNLYYQ